MPAMTTTEKENNDISLNCSELNSVNILNKELPDSPTTYNLYCLLVTLIALVVRLVKISFPDAVVFDEVHFGKFASYYLERRFFFDVHPPLAKLFFALIGYFARYDGYFKFDSVGQSYIEGGDIVAPYVTYRVVNALLGTLIVPLIFNSLKELNCFAITCAFGSLLFALDNAQVCQTRFIFLDTLLLLSIIATIYSYIRYYKCEITPGKSFSKEWYIWLIQTGIYLSCAISCKYVGVMTYATIGIAVLYNLWQLFCQLRSTNMRIFIRYFLQKLNYLVMLPFLLYLFWFWIHFQILIYDGEESEILSETFQDSLIPNEDLFQRHDQYNVKFYDKITIRHSFSEIFLGVGNDTNNTILGTNTTSDMTVWQVLPESQCDYSEWNSILTLNTNVRFQNVYTGKYLTSNNMLDASPETHSEITRFALVDKDVADTYMYEYTLFNLLSLREIDFGHVVSSNKTTFKIFNPELECTLYMDNKASSYLDVGKPLIMANMDLEKIDFVYNNWKIDSIIDLDKGRGREATDRRFTQYPFFSKWSELQNSMFMYNNDLSAEHNFASQPSAWPLSISGVLYWTRAENREQIYFIGNIIAWWFETATLLIYGMMVMVDILLPNSAIGIFKDNSRERMYGPLAFLFIGWACHYFPFYLMERQKFLHHYLPAQMISCLFTAIFWESLLQVNVTKPDNSSQTRRRLFSSYMFLLVPILACFVFYGPIIYGWPVLEPEQLQQREWFDIDLNFT
ncbi:similar to Saccharomyces cerevisiae YJR143C PMT4 Protein O-mannosyltransferase, transfers mannose residues from dolichyl phosphate-D-mannose to protein serine/threonine residues [Maudiozyma saulgeensis]|uniref:Dolichyl-phosphate-mannose--protein mannosyltransferase n=1 Tax=Maudiozyma saulgeensis TaxID=1789683 RepID=A0A1X7R0I0_9SACH|nr:similar to Saccharomyces cerevisiae YJR143C PMT4 Protein O-mannosyltransferase, transfers mannose residues from dolichyl phosphate-D-mannose to protein serine/threonine residues [Kazachstania saulgeensis]